MNDDMTPQAAREALTSAAISSERLQARARWASTKLAVYGAGFALLTVALGLVTSRTLALALIAGWAVLVGAMTLWERRRPAHLGGTCIRTRPYWVGTIAFYGIATAVGVGQAAGDLSYWLGAGIFVAIPMLVGAVRERRA